MSQFMRLDQSPIFVDPPVWEFKHENKKMFAIIFSFNLQYFSIVFISIDNTWWFFMIEHLFKLPRIVVLLHRKMWILFRFYQCFERSPVLLLMGDIQSWVLINVLLHVGNLPLQVDLRVQLYQLLCQHVCWQLEIIGILEFLDNLYEQVLRVFVSHFFIIEEVVIESHGLLLWSMLIEQSFKRFGLNRRTSVWDPCFGQIVQSIRSIVKNSFWVPEQLYLILQELLCVLNHNDAPWTLTRVFFELVVVFLSAHNNQELFASVQLVFDVHLTGVRSHQDILPVYSPVSFQLTGWHHHTVYWSV